MNRLLLSLLIVAGVVHQTNAQDNTTSNILTLDQAITIALKNNRGAKNARLEIEKAGRQSRRPSHATVAIFQNQFSGFAAAEQL